MGHYGSEMGYVSPRELHEIRLRVEGVCPNCNGLGYIIIIGTSYNQRALCYDCRGSGVVTAESGSPKEQADG